MNNDLKLQRKLERLDLTNPIFSDEPQALTYLEGIRWPTGRICPKCGESERTSLVRSRNHRPGLYYCNGCHKTFTVTVGTIFQGSKVPLNKWLLVFRLMVASKKGIGRLGTRTTESSNRPSRKMKLTLLRLCNSCICKL